MGEMFVARTCVRNVSAFIESKTIPNGSRVILSSVSLLLSPIRAFLNVMLFKTHNINNSFANVLCFLSWYRN